MKKTSILFTVVMGAILALGLVACGGNPAESETQLEALNKRLGMFKDAQKFEQDQNYAINELQALMVRDTTISDSLTQWFTDMMKTGILPQQKKLLTDSKEILMKSDTLLAHHADGKLDDETFERDFGSLKAEHDRLTSEMERIHSQMLFVLEEVKKKNAAQHAAKEKQMQ